jgi:IS605 OrfB family transposase
MQLVEKHCIKKSSPLFAELDSCSFAAKNLYNAANYLVRQGFIAGGCYSNYNLIERLMKQRPQYRALPAKVSQQVLMGLDNNWKSFFAAIEQWRENPDKFQGRPNLPKYKDKKGRHVVTYTSQAVSQKLLNKGYLKLSGTSLKLRTKVKPPELCQVRVVPRLDCYVVEVVYKVELNPTQVEPKKIAAIDLGIDNLATLTANQTDFQPILVNGRPLKNINQYYNKRKGSLQSQLQGNRQTSRRVTRLTRCRNHKVDDYLHKASRFIVNLLVQQGIGTLVIGKNVNWKTECEMGARNNQNFVSIPHSRFISMLEYKCHLAGINAVVTEESYTSRASFLDRDQIPTYGEQGANDVKFSGRRITRGLYKSKSGFLINADVNASYNIMRKAIPNALCYGAESYVVQPRRVNPL